MDTALAKRFAAVEGALTALFESVKSINPSMAAAEAFLEQERALANELAVLEQHQRNEKRILDLRREAEENDQKILSVVSLLSETRKKLQDIGRGYRPKAGKEVDFEELLRFAKNISKFTVPPTKRAGDEELAALPSAVELPDTEGEADGYGKKSDKGTGWDQLPEAHRTWLEQFESSPFFPWPSDRIQNGALGTIQKMIDEGVDPTQVELKLPGPPDQNAEAGLNAAATMPAGPSTKPEIGDDGAATGDGNASAKRTEGTVSAAKPATKSGFLGFAAYDSDED